MAYETRKAGPESKKIKQVDYTTSEGGNTSENRVLDMLGIVHKAVKNREWMMGLVVRGKTVAGDDNECPVPLVLEHCLEHVLGQH